MSWIRVEATAVEAQDGTLIGRWISPELINSDRFPESRGDGGRPMARDTGPPFGFRSSLPSVRVLDPSRCDVPSRSLTISESDGSSQSGPSSHPGRFHKMLPHLQASRSTRLLHFLRAGLLPLVCALDTVGLGAAVQAANPPSSPQWNQVAPGTVTMTSPVWNAAPSLQNESGWQVIDTSGGLPTTWQPGPADVARPPVAAAVQVRGVGRGFTVNGNPYPDISLKLPNAFAIDRQFTFSGQLAGTSRNRTCKVGEGQDWSQCADGELFFEITPLKGENASLGINWTIQSLSNRNGSSGTGQSLGFKGALNLTPTLGLAFGGEQIIQFDNNTDLGRNYYLLLSQAVPLSRGEKPAMLVATAGIGSDAFGYGGNGVLGSTNCIGGGNISSKNYPKGTDCYWGPVGALSVAINDRLSIGAEWFGYGIGAGISLRPFSDLPLTATFYATDFLGNTPSYIQDTCTTDPCETRYYGRLTYSF